MRRALALVVNPVAGLGGPAGLKGSDGVAVQVHAVSRGAQARATERAVAALRFLAERAPDAPVLTAAGSMGEHAVRAAGLTPTVVWTPSDGPTTGADTTAAVRAFEVAGAGLVLFVGGDGTARDVCTALDTPGRQRGSATETTGSFGVAEATGAVAVLGVPAGVKMYSSCFAVSPTVAGVIAEHWVQGRVMRLAEAEVLDVDEEALRHAHVEPQLFGTVLIPHEPTRTQARKAPSSQSEAHAAAQAASGAIKLMQPGIHYLLGPGSTVARIASGLGVPKTPLGIDVLLDGQRILPDASERQLLELLPGVRARAIVTVIGGQGFLLGRGNQQLSFRVIDLLMEDPLLVVATDHKLLQLGGRPLIVDTGSPETDARLEGYVRIVTGPSTSTVYPVAAPESGRRHPPQH